MKFLVKDTKLDGITKKEYLPSNFCRSKTYKLGIVSPGGSFEADTIFTLTWGHCSSSPWCPRRRMLMDRADEEDITWVLTIMKRVSGG